MSINAKGIVIKVMDIRDNDRLITVLTASHGIIKAFASGAKKVGHKYHSLTGLFCYSDFTFKESREGTYRIADASPVADFFKLSFDIEALSLAQYFCEIAADLIIDGGQEQLRLLLNCLNLLCGKDCKKSLIKSIFEMRIMTVSGYAPDISACANCGKFDDLMQFSVSEGIITCSDCRPAERSYPMDKTMLSAMRHIVYSDFGRLFSFDIPIEFADKLSKITEDYLIYQTGNRYRTLDFYKSIL